MTPNNIVNMALLNELDIIALSDHNTCGNVRAIKSVADAAGIIFIPAMELETAEEIHMLCLFPEVDSALDFEQNVVLPALPSIKNNERIFGRQIYFDSEDNEIGTDDRYLINATTITVDKVGEYVSRYGGIAIPAHIDKQTKSIISVFGMVDESMGFNVFELSKNVPPDFTSNQFSLKDKNYRYIYDSDAHYLFDIAEKTDKNFIEIDKADISNDKNNCLIDKSASAYDIIEYFRSFF